MAYGLKKMLTKSAKITRKKYGFPRKRNIVIQEALSDLASTDRIKCPDSMQFKSAPYLKTSSKYASILRCGNMDGATPNSHCFFNHNKKIKNLYQMAHKTQTAGQLSEHFLLDHNIKKDKKVLINPRTVIPTVTGHPYVYIHYKQPRNITVREMARLQSFPDDFVFRGQYTINNVHQHYDLPRCSQVGNAVPPLMAEGIGIALQLLIHELCIDKLSIK